MLLEYLMHQILEHTLMMLQILQTLILRFQIILLLLLIQAARHAATTLTTTASPLDYLTLDEGTQAFTLNQVDLGADVTGLLPIADVSVGGTPDGTKFLRDDGTWATPVDIDHDEVTLITTSSPSFVSLSDQELTVGLVDLATDVTGLLPVDELGAGSNGQVLTVTAGTPTWETPAAGHDAVTLDGGSPALDYLTIDNQEINLNLIDLVTDVTGTLSVDNGGTGATTVLGAQQSLDLEPGVDVQRS